MISKTLQLIAEMRERILSEEDMLLATPEDFAYFIPIPENKDIFNCAKDTGLNGRKEFNIRNMDSFTTVESITMKKNENKENNAEEIREVLSKFIPTHALLNEIPSDDEAKRVAGRWKNQPPIHLIYSPLEATATEDQFLKNLIFGLEVVFGTIHTIVGDATKTQKYWQDYLSTPALKQVIICDNLLWKIPNLMPFYRINEEDDKTKKYLLDVPLFLLSDLAGYLANPLLKKKLWQDLSTHLT